MGTMKPSSSSGEKLRDNEDLVTELLLNLPPKAVLRFKSVSKNWCSLTSDPRFRFFHSARQRVLNPTPNSLLLQRKPTAFQFVPLKGEVKPSFDFLAVPNMEIEHACSGLVICSTKNNNVKRYRICNPTTKEFRNIYFPFKDHCALDMSVTLVFDPSKSPHYKLICLHVWMPKSGGKHAIYVFSSKNRSWSLPILSELKHDNGIVCNGTVYWYTPKNTSFYLDLETDTLNRMPEPPMSHEARVPYFGESLGRLVVLVGDCASVKVYEMESHNSGWNFRYDLALRCWPSLAGPLCEFIEKSVLSIVVGKQREDDITIVSYERGEVYSNEIHTRKREKLCDVLRPPSSYGPSVEKYQWRYQWLHAYQHTESLACPWL